MIIKSRLHSLMLGAFAGAVLVPACAMAQDAQSMRCNANCKACKSRSVNLRRRPAKRQLRPLKYRLPLEQLTPRPAGPACL